MEIKAETPNTDANVYHMALHEVKFIQLRKEGVQYMQIPVVAIPGHWVYLFNTGNVTVPFQVQGDNKGGVNNCTE